MYRRPQLVRRHRLNNFGRDGSKHYHNRRGTREVKRGLGGGRGSTPPPRRCKGRWPSPRHASHTAPRRPGQHHPIHRRETGPHTHRQVSASSPPSSNKTLNCGWPPMVGWSLPIVPTDLASEAVILPPYSRRVCLTSFGLPGKLTSLCARRVGGNQPPCGRGSTTSGWRVPAMQGIPAKKHRPPGGHSGAVLAGTQKERRWGGGGRLKEISQKSKVYTICIT